MAAFETPSHTFSRLAFPILLACLSLSGCKKDDGNPSPEGDGGESGMGGSEPLGSASVCKDDDDCNDSIYCNGVEICDQGFCRQGKPKTCDDGIDCTIDRCLEGSASCSNEPPDRDGDGAFDEDCKNKDGDPLGDDCDDDDALSYPGAVEVCDPEDRDEDCDPLTIGNKDADRDGYIDAACCNAQPKGDPLCGDDCDDNKPNVNPEGTEACDFLDNNCDGEVDEGVSIEVYPDKDHDGHGEKDAKVIRSCAGAVGVSLIADDCDDSDPEVFLGQFEICDQKDNNCDGKADEVQEHAPWFADKDGDGYGDAESTPVFSCYRIVGRVLSKNDCDDTNKKVNPNATEICDALDNDCNGIADHRSGAGVNDFEDDDGDGVADSACGGDDCDDTDPRTAGGAEEVCDHIDNDCDGEVDEQTVQNIWYIDEDGDGWGVVIGSALASCDPIANRATKYGDCNDNAPGIHPGTTEYCDGADNDCDGIVDEGASSHCAPLPHAISTCNAGVCDIFSCTPGYENTDGLLKNGCEAPVDLQTTISCITNSDCDDANACNGVETCNAGFCRLGTAINCSSTSTIQGDVQINNGTDLQSMQGIAHITGNLTIDSTSLTSLVGFESLRTVGGDVTIRDNPVLRKLSGSALSGLETVGGEIIVSNNSSLISVDLPSLTSAYSISIIGNKTLPEVSGFKNLLTVSQLIRIMNNPAVTKITGFDVLQYVGGASDSYYGGDGACGGYSMGGVDISFNSALMTISAFGLLSQIDGDLCVDGYSGDQLELPQLAVVGMNLGVFASEGMSFPKLNTVGQTVSFMDAGSGQSEGIQLPALRTAEDMEIYAYTNALPDLDLSSLQGINGHLWIDARGATVSFETFEMPQLTLVDDLLIHMDGPDLENISIPLLSNAGYVDVGAVADSLLLIDLGSLATVSFYLSVQAQVQQLNLDSLTTVGANQDPYAVQLCTGTYDQQMQTYSGASCSIVQDLIDGGYPGMLDGSTCGECISSVAASL